METKHSFYFSDARDMSVVGDSTVDLIMTSPPYPMISMWDDSFAEQIGFTSIESNPDLIFEVMNLILKSVWSECYRVLKDGGFCVINIGDATRTINGKFRLWTNHQKVIEQCTEIGFTPLTNIIWRKPTNTPNKFMGSGMLPCGAYVTLEHEYLLIFRKGDKRKYTTDKEKERRAESAYFWEERNVWFSDLWQINGTKQSMHGNSTRNRNASYPFEIPYRIINMYSQAGDTVLDPFVGIGTTTFAAIGSGRNSIGFEIDTNFKDVIKQNLLPSGTYWNFNKRTTDRLMNHVDWLEAETKKGREFKHFNEGLNTKVVTAQEEKLKLNFVDNISIEAEDDNSLLYICKHHQFNCVKK